MAGAHDRDLEARQRDRLVRRHLPDQRGAFEARERLAQRAQRQEAAVAEADRLPIRWMRCRGCVALLITSPNFAGEHFGTWTGQVITTMGRASG
jgi:hypothetical protein